LSIAGLEMLGGISLFFVLARLLDDFYRRIRLGWGINPCDPGFVVQLLRKSFLPRDTGCFGGGTSKSLPNPSCGSRPFVCCFRRYWSSAGIE
jgi:hypothetical protein